MKMKAMITRTIALLAAVCGLQVFGSFTWNGGTEITDAKWITEGSWTLDDSTTWPTAANSGPGLAGSNAWAPIIINSGAAGTVADLEGWNFRLCLGVANTGATEAGTASTLTVTNMRKLQGDNKYIYIGKGSTLTVNLHVSNSGNDGGTVPITFVGGGTMNLNLAADKGGDATTVNYGSISDASESANVGSFNLASTSSGTAHTYNTLVLKATIGDDINATSEPTLHTITLATITSDITVSSLSYSIGGGYQPKSSVPTAVKTDVGYYYIGKDGTSVKLYYVTGAKVWDGTENDWTSSHWDSSATFAEGDIAYIPSGTVTLASGESVSAQYVKQVGGTASILGNLAVSDSVTVTGGTFKWGENENSENTLTVPQIIVDGSSSKFWLAHSAADMSTTSVALKNGGELSSDDTTFATDENRRDNLIKLNNLNVTGAGAKLTYNWGGAFSFNKLTGDQDVAITCNHGSDDSENFWTIIRTMQDYAGTISCGASKHWLKAKDIDVASGKTITITSQLANIIDYSSSTTNDITKTGDGTLNIRGATDLGTGKILLNNGALNLGPDSESTTINMGGLTAAAGTTLYLNRFSGNLGDVCLNGNTITYHDQPSKDTLVIFNTLNLNGDSPLTVDWKGSFKINALTGSGDVTVTTVNTATYSDKFNLEITNIGDYSGTITRTDSNGTTTLGGSSVTVGKTATVSAAVTLADGFVKSGAGTLVLSNSSITTNGTVTLTGGVLKSAAELDVAVPEGETLEDDTTSESGYHIYSLGVKKVFVSLSGAIGSKVTATGATVAPGATVEATNATGTVIGSYTNTGSESVASFELTMTDAGFASEIALPTSADWYAVSTNNAVPATSKWAQGWDPTSNPTLFSSSNYFYGATSEKVSGIVTASAMPEKDVDASNSNHINESVSIYANISYVDAAANTKYALFSFGQLSGNGFALTLLNNKVYLYTFSSSSISNTSTPMVVDAESGFHLYTVVKSSSGIAFYYDGAFVGADYSFSDTMTKGMKVGSVKGGNGTLFQPAYNMMVKLCPHGFGLLYGGSCREPCD